MIALATAFLLAWIGSTARVELPNRKLAVGEPFDLTFVVEHPAGATITLPEPSALSLSFAFQEDLGRRREPVAGDPARERTTAAWRLSALEGGAVKVPSFSIGVEAGGATESVSTAVVEVAVVGALRADENAPRPPKSFRTAPASSPRRGTAVILAVGAVGVSLLAVWIALRRRRAAPPVTLDPLARLAELERKIAAAGGGALDSEEARGHVYELTRILRDAVDARVASAARVATAAAANSANSAHSAHSVQRATTVAGTNDGPRFERARRAALPDAEWAELVAQDASLPSATRTSVARILAATERWKYAGETPSALGLRETTNEARAALVALSARGTTQEPRT